MDKTLAIIGAGHVARTLGRVLSHAGVFRVEQVQARSQASAEAAVAFVGAGQALPPGQRLRECSAYLLAVPDDQIGAACSELARNVPLDGAVVFHCSGAKDAALLSSARDAGASVASVHPVRSFADPESVARSFAGTWCAVEGDAAALALLEPAFAAAGAQLVRIDPAGKTEYHAACVFASNYLVTVMDAALRSFEAAGIEEHVARQLAAPLAQETLANVLRMGPAAALSGPVARGDHGTVARQHDALTARDSGLGRLYGALAEATLALAQRKRSTPR